MAASEEFNLELRPIDHATMIHVAGTVTPEDASNLDEAIGVLDAEAVVVVSFLDCTHIDASCAMSIRRYDSKRNGRLITVVREDSQPHRVIAQAGRSLQIAFSREDAEHRSDALSAAAHRAFSNDA